mmetsp:Transcript_5155/g.14818  ORF Transcript_5155/g.14818 Transcript_5155/m.14818 type:complete len:255 (+) Transcript_5155:940-1704(+)
MHRHTADAPRRALCQVQLGKSSGPPGHGGACHRLAAPPVPHLQTPGGSSGDKGLGGGPGDGPVGCAGTAVHQRLLHMRRQVTQHRQNEDAAVQATGGDQAAIGLHGDARQRAPVQLGGHQQVRPLEPAAPQLNIGGGSAGRQGHSQLQAAQSAAAAPAKDAHLPPPQVRHLQCGDGARVAPGRQALGLHPGHPLRARRHHQRHHCQMLLLHVFDPGAHSEQLVGCCHAIRVRRSGQRPRQHRHMMCLKSQEVAR